MQGRTKDRLYRTVPLPVLRQVVPRLPAFSNPFLPEILERQVIFVHVPKAGGTSLKTELYGRPRGGHRSIAEFSVYDRQRTEAFFKCAFVRNPWDRLVSAYFFLVQGEGANADNHAFAARHLADTPDFDAFANRLADRGFRQQVVHYDHFRPQSHWICLPRATRHEMDFLGRFESMADDLARLRERLGMAPVGAAPALTWDRPSQHPPYQELYTDRTRAIVADLYAADLALLGYEF